MSVDTIEKAIRAILVADNVDMSAARASGSVDLADMRLSLVDGAAFVDFSAAGVLTPFLNHKLTITDSAGKKAIGYIKAAGTGETYGPELVSDTGFADAGQWNAGAGWSVSGGIATATASSGNLFNSSGTKTTYGALYKTVVDIVRSSGSIGVRYPQHGTKMSATGTYTQYILESYAAGYWPMLTASSFTGTADNLSVKKVLTPSATGVTITSTPGGTTYNWTSIESGFNYNDASGYTYEISAKDMVKTITTRCYPVTLPQNPTYPLILFFRVTGMRDHHLKGPSGLAHPRFQVEAWATTYDAAKTLANAIRTVLDGYSGTVGTVDIRSILIESERDFYEEAVSCHRVIMDFFVWHSE